LRKQDKEEFEIVVVVNAVPCGRAHNIGVENSRGRRIVFIDDDVRIKHGHVIRRITDFLDDESIGICGASQIPPPDSNNFQQRCSRQIGRARFDEVDRFTLTDMATHACMAIRKKTYREVSGEDENMFRNDDSFLRYKVASINLKTGVAPNSAVYHPMPSSIFKLIKTRFVSGKFYSYDYRYHSENIIDTPLQKGEEIEKSSFFKQVMKNIGVFSGSILSGRYLEAISRTAMWAGFLFGLMLNREYFEKKKKKEKRIRKYLKKKKRVCEI